MPENGTSLPKRILGIDPAADVQNALRVAPADHLTETGRSRISQALADNRLRHGNRLSDQRLDFGGF